MNDSPALRFLYRTRCGRGFLKLLIRPWVSRAAGRFLASRCSRFLIRPFIRKNRIPMDGVLIPPGGFASFNDFFIRKRDITFPADLHDRLISPCDGHLSRVPLRDGTFLRVKHSAYTLTDLLEDADLARAFEGGEALIFRLMPVDYHRYCYPADGKIAAAKTIRGVLHCVLPIALETFPVFIRNCREYQVIETEKFGRMVQMEVGALFVGRITNFVRPEGGSAVAAGEEKGYFEFGGSTIILLREKDAPPLNERISEQTAGGAEIDVKIGEPLT